MTKNVPSVKSKNITKLKRQINPEDVIDDQLPPGLTKGKYDIDFAIGICNMVMQHCEQHKFSSSLYISLQYSIDKLKKFLENEKRPRDPDAIINFFCDECKNSELIFARKEKNHACNFCFFNCQPKQIEFLQD